MKKWLASKKVLNTVLSLSSILVMSCSNSTDEIVTNITNIADNTVQAKNYDDPQVLANLSTQLKKQNISLKTQEIEQVKNVNMSCYK